MKKKIKISLIFSIGASLAQLWMCCRCLGQYSIPWYKIAGGGGTSSGGNYQVSGTIGQAEAGSSATGSAYSLTPGFWSFLSVVQTPGAPTLYIGQSGNGVSVFWQNVPGWSLQQNSGLVNTNGWSVSSGVTTVSGTNYLNLTSPAGKMFFRLAHQ